MPHPTFFSDEQCSPLRNVRTAGCGTPRASSPTKCDLSHRNYSLFIFHYSFIDAVRHKCRTLHLLRTNKVRPYEIYCIHNTTQKESLAALFFIANIKLFVYVCVNVCELCDRFEYNTFEALVHTDNCCLCEEWYPYRFCHDHSLEFLIESFTLCPVEFLTSFFDLCRDFVVLEVGT